MRNATNVLIFSLYGKVAASTRYRFLQFVPGLLQAGIEVNVDYLLDSDYLISSFSGNKISKVRICELYASRLRTLSSQRQYHCAIVGAELLPFVPGWIETFLLKIPYIYDFDDAFFLKYKQPRFRYIASMLENKFDSIISRASIVLAGNTFLAAHARSLNPRTQILPTVVDLDRYRCSPFSQADKFTIGWIGSPSTSVYLAEIKAPLARLAAESQVRFVVVGGHCESIPNVEIVNLPWSESTEIDLINSFDVGVMPLFDNDWARGKCAFKLIQYMACGVPFVASRVGANIELVDETCGFLASAPEQWFDVLENLRDHPDLRWRMGRAGREKIEDRYSLKVALPVMVDAIRSCVGESKQMECISRDWTNAVGS